MSSKRNNPEDASSASATADELKRRSDVLAGSYRLFYRRPVHVATASGFRITEADGNVLVDAYNNVPVVGHSNPVVADRVCSQLKEQNTHTRYLNSKVADYAERLLEKFEPALDKVIFTSTGSEANDLAIQIARIVTGNQGVIVTGHAYHGTTQALHALSPSLSKTWVTPDTGMVQVPSNASSADEFKALFLRRLDSEIDRLQSCGAGVAALLIDSLMTSDGIFPLPTGLLSEAAARVRDAGGLWIADEVQSGFGRVGSHWWGYQRHNSVPDLVVLGKPMGNGLPIGALVGRGEILDAYGEQFRYFNTFGGNPVCLAAASAVLDEIEERELLSSSSSLGALLEREIAAVLESAHLPFSVRSCGLMLGLDTGISDSAGLLANLMRERSVLVGTTGTRGQVLKVRPPLVIDEEGISAVVSSLADAVNDPEFRRNTKSLDSTGGTR